MPVLLGKKGECSSVLKKTTEHVKKYFFNLLLMYFLAFKFFRLQPYITEWNNDSHLSFYLLPLFNLGGNEREIEKTDFKRLTDYALSRASLSQ